MVPIEVAAGHWKCDEGVTGGSSVLGGKAAAGRSRAVVSTAVVGAISMVVATLAVLSTRVTRRPTST